MTVAIAPLAETVCLIDSKRHPIIDARNSVRTHQNQRTIPPTAAHPDFVLDGLNNICTNQFHLSLEVLLAVVTDMAENGYEFICVFDGNTRYRLRECLGAEYEAAYLKLLEKYHLYFVEVRGIEADHLVLHATEAWHARVVSTDSYRDYEEDFPFILEEDRFIKVNGCRNLLVVGRKRLEVPPDLNYAMARFEEAMAGGLPC